MDTFVNFLVDNYLWFIGITAVLIFSLIGYLVESSKNPKTEKLEEKVEEEVLEPIIEEEVKTKKKEKPKKEKKKKEKKKKEKDPILEDDTPTIEEAMKMEAEKKQEEVNKIDPIVPEAQTISTPTAQDTPSETYDAPLMSEQTEPSNKPNS